MTEIVPPKVMPTTWGPVTEYAKQSEPKLPVLQEVQAPDDQGLLIVSLQVAPRGLLRFLDTEPNDTDIIERSQSWGIRLLSRAVETRAATITPELEEVFITQDGELLYINGRHPRNDASPSKILDITGTFSKLKLDRTKYQFNERRLKRIEDNMERLWVYARQPQHNFLTRWQSKGVFGQVLSVQDANIHQRLLSRQVPVAGSFKPGEVYEKVHKLLNPEVSKDKGAVYA